MTRGGRPSSTTRTRHRSVSVPCSRAISATLALTCAHPGAHVRAFFATRALTCAHPGAHCPYLLRDTRTCMNTLAPIVRDFLATLAPACAIWRPFDARHTLNPFGTHRWPCAGLAVVAVAPVVVVVSVVAVVHAPLRMPPWRGIPQERASPPLCVCANDVAHPQRSRCCCGISDLGVPRACLCDVWCKYIDLVSPTRLLLRHGVVHAHAHTQ